MAVRYACISGIQEGLDLNANGHTPLEVEKNKLIRHIPKKQYVHVSASLAKSFMDAMYVWPELSQMWWMYASHPFLQIFWEKNYSSPKKPANLALCGIILIWGKGANKLQWETLMAPLQHRGPDQEAAFSPWPGNLGCGVNRLKIINPEAGCGFNLSASPWWRLFFWFGMERIYNTKDLGKATPKNRGLLTWLPIQIRKFWCIGFAFLGIQRLEKTWGYVLAYSWAAPSKINSCRLE